MSVTSVSSAHSHSRSHAHSHSLSQMQLSRQREQIDKLKEELYLYEVCTGSRAARCFSRASDAAVGDARARRPARRRLVVVHRRQRLEPRLIARLLTVPQFGKHHDHLL